MYARPPIGFYAGVAAIIDPLINKELALIYSFADLQIRMMRIMPSLRLYCWFGNCASR